MSSFEAMTYLMRTILLVVLLSAELSLFAQIENAVPFRDGNKWGWADVHTGKIMIEPVYDSVKYEYDKGYLIFRDGKMGAVGYQERSNDCKIIVPPHYDDIYKAYYADDLYITTLNKKMGVYRVGSGKVVGNDYYNIERESEFLLLFSFEYNGGLFSLVNKNIIDTLSYSIYKYGKNFWTESFKFEKDILLENTTSVQDKFQ